jgi:hypothetical protein
MRTSIFATPRPVPGRLLPAAGGLLVVLLALPVFVVGGWDLRGWALGALLWAGLEAVEALLTRLRGRTANVAASAVLAFGLSFKALAVLAVLVAAAATEPDVAVGAAVVYVLAYTLQLALALVTYFGAER